MGIRDEENKRLDLYAKALGTQVITYSRSHKYNRATVTEDGSKMEIYRSPGMSLTELILVKIHELGHILVFIHDSNRKIPKRLSRAWEKENQNLNLSENERYLIYKDELDAIAYWDTIIADCNIKIPRYKIEIAKESDIYPYEYFYRHGKYPTLKLRREKLKEITQKWKARK